MREDKRLGETIMCPLGLPFVSSSVIFCLVVLRFVSHLGNMITFDL